MNKKTYILGFIAIAFLAGIIWYATNNQESENQQTASIVDSNQSEDNKPAFVGEQIDDFVVGSPEAPVTMIEYSSHFCGYCIDFHEETLPVLTEKYIKTGKVKLISRFVSPLEIGLAILCAEEENKFTEMSDYFFKNIESIQTVGQVKTKSLEVVSDKDNFEACYDSKKYEDKVKAWFDSATSSGVEGTPTFYINGQELVGNQPVSVFEQVIEKALEVSGIE